MMAPDHCTFRTIVLVVDDEMLLRMRAVDMVEDAGYASVEAVDADEAVAILESRSDIGLVFTDIQMPGSMDGLKLAHTVHQRWPSIGIILVSGQLKPENVDIPANSRFFGKPIEADDMIAQMRTMIGRNRR
jgi:CheY-like chemotaxis protein